MFGLFKKKAKKENTAAIRKDNNKAQQVAERKGELGEYKINIQLDQMSKQYRHVSDIMLENPKSSSGYSQIDHVLITPYGIFVIETKNYQGTIYGDINRKQWSVNGKFKMQNPFHQNYGHIKIIQQLINKKYENHFISLVSFTKRCTFKIPAELRKIQSNELIVYDIELTDFIHRKVSIISVQNERKALFTAQEIEHVYQTLLEANITDGSLRKKHNTEIQKVHKEKEQKKSVHKCEICNKPVSEKVVSYCQSNKRFNGKIYCYEHQKIL